MKFIKKAKETWGEIKDTQRAYVFQSVWFGKLVPGMPLSESMKAKSLMNQIKIRVGKFPGLMYQEIYQNIQDFKDAKISKEVLQEKLFVFYPIKSTLTLKVSKEDIDFNIGMRFKIMKLDSVVLDEVLIDLKKSEERDKAKVLSSI